MQPLSYIKAHSIQQVVGLLQSEGEKAHILCGGTDLIVQLREGRRVAGLLIDIKSIPEVNVMNYDPADGLTIGAAVSCSRIIADPLIIRHYPGLIDAVSLIGGIQIQNRASMGGNLCNASPAADSAPALIAHGGFCITASQNGQRRIPVEDFCTGPGRTVLKPGEMLVALNLPPHISGSGGSYQRITPRQEMDIAIVGAGAVIRLDEDHKKIAAVKIAIGAVAPRPLAVPEAADVLVGLPVSDESFKQAASLAQKAARPISDMRGSDRQRCHLVGVLVRRTLRSATNRAMHSSPEEHNDGR